ncbi:hypothetical protein [Fortiea contorta]|uniref:hypothetical protein n=1 Tax=Fortiea contorta TaxID=1892405 RepID=UPI0012B5D596|nr:hypothetical protein [Fortiea contorta]
MLCKFFAIVKYLENLTIYQQLKQPVFINSRYELLMNNVDMLVYYILEIFNLYLKEQITWALPGNEENWLIKGVDFCLDN